MHSRIQHEIEPSCVLPVFFGHVKDFGAARDGDADGLKSLPMDIRWVTMHSRMARCLHDSPPKLKLFIIVCPSPVKIG